MATNKAAIQGVIYSTDTNGNVTGLVGPSGQTVVTPYRAFTGAPNSGTNSLTNVVLQTVTIPKGMFTVNSRLRIDSLWTANSGVNQKFQNVYVNTIGAGLSGAAQLLGYNFTNYQTMGATVWLWNKNALTSQIAGYAITLSPTNLFNSALVSSAFDTSQGLDVIFAGQVANIADNSTLAAYSVELIN